MLQTLDASLFSPIGAAAATIEKQRRHSKPRKRGRSQEEKQGREGGA